jgi:hypothetical protein
MHASEKNYIMVNKMATYHLYSNATPFSAHVKCSDTMCE